MIEEKWFELKGHTISAKKYVGRSESGEDTGERKYEFVVEGVGYFEYIISNDGRVFSSLFTPMPPLSDKQDIKVNQYWDKALKGFIDKWAKKVK